MNGIIWFFDLYSQYKTDDVRPHKVDGSEVGNGVQWLIYSACLAGIFLGPFVIDAANGKYPTFGQMFTGLPQLFWSIVIAFVLTALLFKVLLKPTTPLVAQIGTALAVGMGSGKLLPIALEALTKIGS